MKVLEQMRFGAAFSSFAAERKAFSRVPGVNSPRTGNADPRFLVWNSRSFARPNKKRINPMRKILVSLATLAGLLLLGACDHASSSIFDNNCTGNGAIENPDYCTGTLHPNAGPYAGHTE
jgi:hypothetical protein